MGEPEKATFRWMATLFHGVLSEILGSESQKTGLFEDFIRTKIGPHTDPGHDQLRNQGVKLHHSDVGTRKNNIPVGGNPPS